MYYCEILNDGRGSMRLYKYKDMEYKICEIKKGMARGGDVHNYAEQYDLVLYGKIKFIKKENNIDKIQILVKNDFIEIKRGIPHVFIALEDSLLIEWRNGPFERKIYEPYRKLCEGINDSN
jgi:mannose-6-phosphate isomerase-like protein (cupin superfamily)